MKLDLKKLRGQPGEPVAISGKLPLLESDFNEPVALDRPLVVKGSATWYAGDVVELQV